MTWNHVPEFSAPLCGDTTDRERLGLPEHYFPDRLATDARELFGEMRSWKTDRLLETVSHPELGMAMRIVAGNVLALEGDPRIETRKPVMVEIPGASFHMGLDPSRVAEVLARFSKLGLEESWIRKECPRHKVCLTDFKIGKYPITNMEYRDFLLDSQFPELPSSWSFRRFPEAHANHPVYTVTARAAQAYAQWLAQKTGRNFRLPTEAEWEYAAGGPGEWEFPWGNDFDETRCNTCETGVFDSTPVGAFPGGQSAFSVFDLAGNVEEYVADVYRPYPGGEFVGDHLSRIHGDYFVARGGSFARFRDLARTRRRHGFNPRSSTYAMGFRLAETV